MKNKLIAILICVVLGMTGCSGSSEKEGESKAETQVVDEEFSIAMTDDYTFTDPEELEFDKRIVLTGDESCKLLSDMAKMGYEATNIYHIMYVKDGEAVGEYQYFVTEDEKSAITLAEFYSSQGQQITQQGNVLYAYMDADTSQANIIMFSSMGSISEETPEAYMEEMKNFNGLIEYN